VARCRFAAGRRRDVIEHRCARANAREEANDVFAIDLP
jgi:hypothetical protein